MSEFDPEKGMGRFEPMTLLHDLSSLANCAPHWDCKITIVTQKQILIKRGYSLWFVSFLIGDDSGGVWKGAGREEEGPAGT